MIDREKFGEALAKTLDRLETLEANGELAGFETGEVLVVAAFKQPVDDPTWSDQVNTLIFVDGSTQVPWEQLGILQMAMPVARGIATLDDD